MIVAGSASGASPRSRASSSATFAPRNGRGRHSRTTPALIDSPRSTRGTTRITAYWNWLVALRGGSGTFRLLDECPPRLEARQEVLNVGVPLRIGAADQRVGGQPVVG